MSALLYPTLPGLGFDVIREPQWNTGYQKALSGKRTSLAYQLYPLTHFELTYNVLPDNITPSDLKALKGFYGAMFARADTFLFNDPDFNTVSNMPFAVMDGVTASYQTTATYGNVGSPGYADIIQNFNGAPNYFVNRYGPLMEPIFNSPQQNFALHSQDFTVSPWTVNPGASVTLSGLAPDATSTADIVTETSTANVQRAVGQGITVPSAVAQWTFSCFVQGLNRNLAFLELTESTGGTAAIVWFNLATATFGTVSTGANWSGVIGKIEQASNAAGIYYRLSIIGVKTSAATSISAFVCPANADGALTYAGIVSNPAIRIWGGQFEQSAVPTFYLPTTSAIVTDTHYTLGATGILTPSAKVNGNTWTLAWSGSFFYRCAFDDDSIPWAKFMNKLWKAGPVKFTSIIL